MAARAAVVCVVDICRTSETSPAMTRTVIGFPRAARRAKPFRIAGVKRSAGSHSDVMSTCSSADVMMS